MTENKDMKHTLFKKQDLILIAVVLAAAALLFLGTKLMHKSPADADTTEEHSAEGESAERDAAEGDATEESSVEKNTVKEAYENETTGD